MTETPAKVPFASMERVDLARSGARRVGRRVRRDWQVVLSVCEAFTDAPEGWRPGRDGRRPGISRSRTRLSPSARARSTGRT